MNVQPIRTRRVEPSALTLFELLDESIETLDEKSIVVITSKVVSLCEGSVVPTDKIDRESLIAQESDFYLPTRYSVYGHHFSIKDSTLIASAGVDQSNGDGQYILWPKDSWKSANEVREYLCDKFNLKNIGVIITDSTCQPLRRGTTGIALGYSGFKGLRNYIGTPDLFNRPFSVTYANIAGGLAAAAVVTMGEGAESMPIAVISDVSFVSFDSTSPTQQEIAECTITPKDDLFAPFLNSVDWISGGDSNNQNLG